MYRPDNPLIVQRDHTLMLEVAHPAFRDVRDALSTFAELVKSPSNIHTYRITPLSLWHAAAAGMTAETIVSTMKRWSKFDIPPSLIKDIWTYVGRFGLLKLEKIGDSLVLTSQDQAVLQQLCHKRELSNLHIFVREDGMAEVPPKARGLVKQALLKLGYPVEDLAGYAEGERLSVSLLCPLRPYQQEAVEAFYQQGDVSGGSGVIVMPCGSGKTVVGLGVMEKVGRATLILTPNGTSVKQWIREIGDKTSIPRELVGEYTGMKKEVKPVTVATYQILTSRASESGTFTHLGIFQERDWGLIIYDEVHLLPAPVFRATASLQAKRRLGLTATLVREDGREQDVFSLVGPKKKDVPWKVLEQDGWIARASCVEIRTPLTYERQKAYAKAKRQEQYRIASENPRKIGVLKRILARHRRDRVLVIGQYISQLNEVAEEIGAPLITGDVPEARRNRLYDMFRQGKIPVLVVSKVANFALDLPDASVAVQLSGAFGSRQEEAQRLGRILRPKSRGNEAYFYTIVTRGTKDETYAMNRQRFLVEQGYHYSVLDAEDMDVWEVSS